MASSSSSSSSSSSRDGLIGPLPAKCRPEAFDAHSGGEAGKVTDVAEILLVELLILLTLIMAEFLILLTSQMVEFLLRHLLLTFIISVICVTIVLLLCYYCFR